MTNIGGYLKSLSAIDIADSTETGRALMVARDKATANDILWEIKTEAFTAAPGGHYVCAGTFTVTNPISANDGQMWQVVVAEGEVAVNGVSYSPSRWPLAIARVDGAWTTLPNSLTQTLSAGGGITTPDILVKDPDNLQNSSLIVSNGTLDIVGTAACANAGKGSCLSITNANDFDPGEPLTVDGRARIVHGMTFQSGINNFVNDSDHTHVTWSTQNRNDWQLIQNGGDSTSNPNYFSIATVGNNTTTTLFNVADIYNVDTNDATVGGSSPFPLSNVKIRYNTNATPALTAGQYVSVTFDAGAVGIVDGTYVGTITSGPNIVNIDGADRYEYITSLNLLSLSNWVSASKSSQIIVNNDDGIKRVRLSHSPQTIAGTKVSLEGNYNGVARHVLVTMNGNDVYEGMPVVFVTSTSIIDIPPGYHNAFVKTILDYDRFVLSIGNPISGYANTFGVSTDTADWYIVKGSTDAVHQYNAALQHVTIERYPTSDTSSTTTGGNKSVAIGQGTEAVSDGSMAFGSFNTASGDFSTVGGGIYNTVSGGRRSTIGGGKCNTVSGSCSTVSGGYSNIVSGDGAVVAGGRCNTAPGNCSTVSGGYCNSTTGGCATIGGGYCNIASQRYTTISGGYKGVASDDYSTVSGGYCNTASSENTVVGGGYQNTASGYNSVSTGGRCNTSSSYYTTVGGGLKNTASGYYSTVGGGLFNAAKDKGSAVGAGFNNTSIGIGSVIAGGFNNRTAGYLPSVVSNRTYDGLLAQTTLYVTGDVTSEFSASGTNECIEMTYNNSFSSPSKVLLNLISISFDGTHTLIVVPGNYTSTANYNGPKVRDVLVQATLREWNTISGGRDNTASGYSGSVIGGGCRNYTRGYLSTIGGGRENHATACSFVGGGTNNAALQVSGVIGGGSRNTITHQGLCGVISGGECNTVCCRYGAIGGGRCNTSSGQYSTIGGGVFNTTTSSGYRSTIGGGESNTVSGFYSTVSGGYRNTSSDYYSIAAAGFNNTSSGKGSVISGGINNRTSGFGAFVVTGASYDSGQDQTTFTLNGNVTNYFSIDGTLNCIEIVALSNGFGPWRQIANLVGKTADSNNTYILVTGNYTDTESEIRIRDILAGSGGTNNTISGGSDNTASGYFSFIGGGQHNNISYYSCFNVIGGGTTNSTSGCNSVIAGGSNNTAAGLNPVISGGQYNCVSGGVNLQNATISGGSNNSATDTGTTIGGGAGNYVAGNYSVVAGGESNCALGNCFVTKHITIGGGGYNTASGSHTTISGGCKNIAGSRLTTIGGGLCNFACNATPNNATGAVANGIGANTSGGSWSPSSAEFYGSPTVFNAGCSSTVSGGFQNVASGNFSSVAGGRCNTASGVYSVVGGGACNSACAYSTVVGGINNRACNNVWGYSTVVGGVNNVASGSGTFIGGGDGNVASNDSAMIVGGNDHISSGRFSSVNGGCSNTASASYSSIIGGLRGLANKYGEVAHSSGSFDANRGTAQHSLTTFFGTTNDAIPTKIFLDGSSANFIVENNTSYGFLLKVIGVTTSTGLTNVYYFKGFIKNVGGTTSLSSTLIKEEIEESVSMDVALTANDTTNSLDITVTGVASTDIRWVAVLDCVKVSF
jgi:hypothetical protein